MPQAWAADHPSASCSVSYSCYKDILLDELCNGINAFHNLWKLVLHVQYFAVLAIHLSFLFLVLIITVWKKLVRISKSSRLGWTSATERAGGISAAPLYTLSRGACALLCLAHTVVVIWGIHAGLEKGWNHVALLLSAGFVQAIAWLLMTTAVTKTKAERRAKFPPLLRLWWAMSFLLSALRLFSKYNTKAEGHGMVELDTWVEMVALPLCTFLCIVAVSGRTGLSVIVLHNLQEPLLNVCGDEAASPLKPGKKATSSYGIAGLFSQLTFSWLDALMAVGYRKPLELDDIPPLAQVDQASSVLERFKMNWDRIEPKSLVKCIFLSLWKAALSNACIAGLYTCASYVGPFLIDDFVEYIGGRRRFPNEGYVLAGLFCGAKFVETFAQRHWYFDAQKLGLHVTEALTALIYSKGLTLSSQSRCNHTSGEIINYVSVDVQRVNDFAWFINDLWLLPLQFSLAFTILYKNLGIAALAAFVATILTMLANVPLTTILEKYQNNLMKSKDARMRATSEVLRSMRILKLQAWELRYLKKLEDLRAVECGWLRRFFYIDVAVTSVFWCTPAIVAVITFSTCVLIGVPLTSGRVLAALATFRILQDPIYGIPDLVATLTETRVSLHRLESFLQEQELDMHAVERLPVNEGNVAVEVHNALFSWDGSPKKPTVTIAQLEIKKGLRVAVCGSVGSGKSSFISCILGEIPKLLGTVKVTGTRAYVAQSAWIQSGTIQDNVLFGQPMDRDKYDQVLEACTLEKDLELLPHGDQTEIGERGINLSGGQKQRIQLARALYRDADIYLLDDPFSAVDAHTGSHLFKECILGILGSKTVLYVTHQVEFLPMADLILVFEDGKVVQEGRFDDLLQAGTSFSRLIGAHTKALESIDGTGSSALHDKSSEMMDTIVKDEQDSLQGNSLMQDRDGETMDSKSLKQLVQEEERETGRVSLAVYWSLVTAVHRGALVPFLLLAQVFFQALQIVSNYWMAWATPLSFNEHPKFSSKFVLLVYVGLAAASSLCVCVRSLLLSTVALKTAQTFFMKMLHSIFHAPMSFFDATPIGRILNRASTDQSALDLEVCNRFSGLAFNTIQLLGIIAVMSQVAWPVFAMFFPVMSMSIWLQTYYMESARELSRLVGIRKSPILQHFGETISGAATIRGFDQESQFEVRNLELLDCYARPLFNNFAAMEWLGLRLNVMANIIFTSALLLVVSLPEATIDASIAGLAVTYGLNLNFLQYKFVWNLCRLENKIISVERIQQYSKIPSEAPLVIENFQPPSDWPSKGTIALEGLQVRYAPYLPLVLRGITCTFLGGKKIGVVGRTGSGKSTLLQALFRIVEPAAGQIVIDDIDISKIGLHDLRSKLSIIPQDPTMFEGTMRNNLDPLEEHTDAEIWEALDKSQLGDIVRAKNGKLETSVSENGENWSMGQRQLVCLGRALLKRTRILVLDEATASVDTATDSVIQNTIRTEFSQCTVITIAHRIPTVIDSDWVLLLSDGRVAEYDTSSRLLEDKASLFAKLVSEYTTRSNNAMNVTVTE